MQEKDQLVIGRGLTTLLARKTMNGFELNKIAAAILLAGVITMSISIVTEVLYEPERTLEKRGYEIAGAEEAAPTGGAPAAPAKPVDIALYMAAGDAAAGEVLFKKCAICHDVSKGGPNKIGPNLWGALGRDVGKHEGFAYSDAIGKHGGHWGYQELSEFLTAPAKYAKGTKMAFVGLAKPEERANMIAYLRSMGDTQLPLPVPPEVEETPAAEAPADAPKAEAKAEAPAEAKK